MGHSGVEPGFERWIRRGEEAPFNRLLGLEVVSARRGRCEVRLPEQADAMNSYGSVHAVAIPAPADLAAGLALLTVLGPEIENGMVLPVARRMSVSYHRVARGALTAIAQVDDEEAARLLSDLHTHGRACVDTAAEVYDGEGELASTVAIEWDIHRNEP